MVGAGLQIVGDFFGGGFADKDGAVFLAFAADDEFAAVEVDGVAVEVDEFGDAQTGGEEEFDDGAVAEVGFGVGGDGVEDVRDFVDVEEGDLFFGSFWQFDEGGIEGIDVAFGKIGEEAAQGDEVVGLCGGGKFGVALVFVAVEPEAVLAEEFGGDLFGRDVSGEFDEAREIEVVVAGGVDGTAFFDLEGFEEFGDEIR